MIMEENKSIIENTQKKSKAKQIIGYVVNKYAITILIFLVWMIFFDNTSFLVIKGLNDEIRKHEQKVEYYKSEYEKNTAYYDKLMNNKGEKEKFARENYFMKKSDEEIFILVADTTRIGN